MKVQLTLTNEEAQILSAKASKLGYNTTKFIKFLITREAVSVIGQAENTRMMSSELENKGLDAVEAYKAEKTIEFESVDELLS